MPKRSVYIGGVWAHRHMAKPSLDVAQEKQNADMSVKLKAESEIRENR